MRREMACRLAVGLLMASALCLAVAPLLMPDTYSLVEHTTSESAAQGTEGAWLARTGFLLFGLAVLCTVACVSSWPSVARWAHASFGVLMISAAAFSHRPFLDGVAFAQFEDLLHFVAATAMGFAFAIGVAFVALLRSSVRPRDLAALIASIAIPIGMTFAPEVVGILQRVMFAVAMWWYGTESIRSPVTAETLQRA